MKILVFSVLLLGSVACNQAKRSEDTVEATYDVAAAETASSADSKQAEAAAESDEGGGERPADPAVNSNAAEPTRTDAQIVKTAQVSFQVNKLTESATAIGQLTRQYGGFVALSNETHGTDRHSSTISIRVSNERFEPLLADILKQATYVASKNVTAEDVTEEFVDIQARLKAKREVEQRYLDILRRAGSIKDVLAVESQLGQIREEIERMEGRLKYLRDQVRYSTINLEVYETVPYQTEPGLGFFSRLGRSFSQGWEGLLEVLVGLAAAWPFWLILGGIIYAVVRWRRRRRI